jgi:RNA polymerase sigma-70 factor (ECF subfamily)
MSASAIPHFSRNITQEKRVLGTLPGSCLERIFAPSSFISDITNCETRCLNQRMEDLEREAIRRVLVGDREEYRVLMERHLPAVLRMTFRVTGNLEDAEEAAQEAFLLAYKKLTTFREQAAFGTWVYRIAMNCALNLVKRRTRNPEWHAESLEDAGDLASPVSPGPTPEAILLHAEAERERERAMCLLTPMEKTAFILRHIEEQPVNVIATALGISANSARQTLFRAVGKLRRELGPPRSNPSAALASSPLLKELP